MRAEPVRQRYLALLCVCVLERLVAVHRRIRRLGGEVGRRRLRVEVAPAVGAQPRVCHGGERLYARRSGVVPPPLVGGGWRVLRDIWPFGPKSDRARRRRFWVRSVGNAEERRRSWRGGGKNDGFGLLVRQAVAEPAGREGSDQAALDDGRSRVRRRRRLDGGGRRAGVSGRLVLRQRRRPRPPLVAWQVCKRQQAVKRSR
jgi:hypothetical protein